MNLPERLHSLDVFRGICIAGMILVDHPGSWEHTYPALTHSSWNGWSFADLIFPFFIFIMGVSFVFSITGSYKKGATEKDISKKIITRGSLLFLIGLLLNGFPFFTWDAGFSFIDLSHYRLMGVLQRIAVVYLVCGFLYLKFNYRQIAYIGIGILVSYWLILKYIPVPGFGTPDLFSYPEQNSTNIAIWLDKLILGSHIPEWASFDPEGILSTIPSIVSGIIGLLAGKKIKYTKDIKETLLWMVVWGGVLVIIASFWNMYFPINKQLWTSTFVLHTSGLALISFASLFWLIDYNKHLKFFKPLKILGMNAIFIFSVSLAKIFFLYAIQLNWNGSKMFLNDIIADSLFFSWLPKMEASFMFAVSSLMVFYLLAVYLYRNQKFIKI